MFPVPGCYNSRCTVLVLLCIYPSTLPCIQPSSVLFFFDAFQSKLKTAVHFTSRNFSMHVINQSSMFAFASASSSFLGKIHIQFNEQILSIPFYEF